MREPADLASAYICPRCGDEQVVIEDRGDRIAVSCPACEYEVVRLPRPRQAAEEQLPQA